MVNTETTTMSANGSNAENTEHTESNPKASLPGFQPEVTETPQETELGNSFTKTEVSKTFQVSNSDSTTKKVVNTEDTAGAVNTRELDESESEVNPSNQTTPLSDTSYKRIQSTLNTVNSKVVSLVHWENTLHSGAVLVSILAFLVLTAYSSLFNIFCGLALVTIGCDWIYVLATKQFKTILNKDAANPHEKYLKNPPQIKREDLDKYVDIWVEIINLSLAETTKIALIENPLRSMKYVAILYTLWTIASWFSFRTITAIVVITAFAVPKLYKRHEGLVNQHLGKAQVLAKGYIDTGVEVVSKNTGDLIPKIQKFATSQGWIANPDAAKKQE